MDAFIEKLVLKRKKGMDYLVSFGIVALSFIVAIALLVLTSDTIIREIALLLAIGAIYLGFRLQSRTSVEFEYLVTNGALDVDKIVAQRKRVRIFSGDCREFDAMGKVNSRNHGPHITNGAQVIFAGTDMGSDDLYFVSLSYKGRKTVLYFEPDQRMIDSFRRFIPKKLLT
ncbi:MAG: hypothetical protein LBJ10_08580 [Clostridiales bacterium]|jgi:hypothetical protein|nr:hypothetical protein [Clostridiales bacterium]